jgi:hypothetical protein
MTSPKVGFPLLLREGVKRRGELHPAIQLLVARTLTLPREAGGNLRLVTRSLILVFMTGEDISLFIEEPG